MEDLIMCSVCLRQFHDPRVLPCQHTFCLKPCLEKIFDSNGCIIKCPLCRVSHFITRGSVSGLPKNFTIQKLIDMPNNAIVNSQLCRLCNSKTEKVMNCECCSNEICLKCYNLHINKTKNNLATLNASLKENLSIQTETFRQLNAYLSSMENDKNKLVSSIDKVFNDTFSLLQQRKLKFMQELTAVYEPMFSKWKGLAEIKEVDVAVLSSSIQSAAESINKENVSQGNLLVLLNSIKNTVPTHKTPESFDAVQIKTGEFIFDMELVENTISKFGEIRWSSGDTVNGSMNSNTLINTEKTNKHLKHENPNITNANMSNSNQDQRMNREKTYLLNRPVKSIAYEISLTTNEPVQMTLQSTYLNKSTPLVTFGGKGTGPGEFIWPRGIAIDNEYNRIIVADSSNHRIQIFSDKGQFEHMISELSCDEERQSEFTSTFDCLSGIAYGKGNRIVCSDRYNHRAIIMDTNGRFIQELGKSGIDSAKLSYPWGIAIDSNENILICDKDNHRIQVFSKTGEYKKEIGSHGRQAGMFDNPHYLAICPKTKNIFISDTSNHRIQVFDKQGLHLYSFSGDGPTKFHLKYPRGIAIDSDGNILVCDYGNNRISIFTNKGRSICTFGSHGSNNGQFKGLEGIAVFKDGRIVVSDRDNHRIQIF